MWPGILTAELIQGLYDSDNSRPTRCEMRNKVKQKDLGSSDLWKKLTDLKPSIIYYDQNFLSWTQNPQKPVASPLLSLSWHHQHLFSGSLRWSIIQQDLLIICSARMWFNYILPILSSDLSPKHMYKSWGIQSYRLISEDDLHSLAKKVWFHFSFQTDCQCFASTALPSMVIGFERLHACM